MKKLLSLMLVLCLLPMFSLAEHSIAANYIYQMILKQVDGTDFTLSLIHISEPTRRS